MSAYPICKRRKICLFEKLAAEVLTHVFLCVDEESKQKEYRRWRSVCKWWYEIITPIFPMHLRAEQSLATYKIVLKPNVKKITITWFFADAFKSAMRKQAKISYLECLKKYASGKELDLLDIPFLFLDIFLNMKVKATTLRITHLPETPLTDFWTKVKAFGPEKLHLVGGNSKNTSRDMSGKQKLKFCSTLNGKPYTSFTEEFKFLKELWVEGAELCLQQTPLSVHTMHLKCVTVMDWNESTQNSLTDLTFIDSAGNVENLPNLTHAVFEFGPEYEASIGLKNLPNLISLKFNERTYAYAGPENTCHVTNWLVTNAFLILAEGWEIKSRPFYVYYQV